DIEAWRNMINSNNLNLDAWLHACDGAGNSSPAAKLMGVEAAPRIILIEPEGRAVSLDMESDEVVMRVEQILSGDLYYLDQEE
ncbi:MAG: TlpA family protein disulfide reductase, partial [Bacteroidaceae bacterium]|nr:TlpA family protein disulfide reductase [Bacteroidaceae bacterium]